MVDRINGATDSSTLRVYANSERMRILAVLRKIGPCNVGMISDKIGLAPGSVSYHLKRLSAAGLITKCEGKGDKRQSWWTITPLPLGPLEEFDDGAEDTDLLAVRRASSQSYFAAYSRYLDKFDDYDDCWHGAELGFDTVLHLNSDELFRLGEELEAVIERWANSPKESEGKNKKAVAVTLRGFPWIP